MGGFLGSHSWWYAQGTQHLWVGVSAPWSRSAVMCRPERLVRIYISPLSHSPFLEIN